SVGRKLDRRDIAQGEQAFLLERAKIPSQAARDAPDLARRLFEAEVNSRLAMPRAFEQELQTEQRLARAGPALHHGDAQARCAAASSARTPARPHPAHDAKA